MPLPWYNTARFPQEVKELHYIKSLDYNLPNVNGGFVALSRRSAPIQR